jgi:hypothetical protein
MSNEYFFTSTTSTADNQMPTSQIKSFRPPVPVWKVIVGGEDGIQIFYTPEQLDQVPNWFHRKMQEFILGFKWQKL